LTTMANADALLNKLCDFSNLSVVLKEIMGQFNTQHDEQQRQIEKLRRVQDDLCKFSDSTPNAMRTMQESLSNMEHNMNQQARQMQLMEKWVRNSEDKLYEQRLSALEEQMRKQAEMMDALRGAYEGKADKVEVMREMSLKASAADITQARTEVLRSGATLRRDVEQAIEAINATLSSGLSVAKRTADTNCERLSHVETQMKTVNVNANIENFIDARLRELSERVGIAESFSDEVANRVGMSETRVLDNNKTIKRLALVLDEYKAKLARRTNTMQETQQMNQERERDLLARIDYVEQNKAEHASVARELDDLAQQLAGLGANDPRVMCTKDYVNDRVDRMRERLQHMETTLSGVNSEVTHIVRKDREKDREYDRRMMDMADEAARRAQGEVRRRGEVADVDAAEADLVARIVLDDSEELAPTQPLTLGPSTNRLLRKGANDGKRVGGGYNFNQRSPPPPIISYHDQQLEQASSPHLRVGSPTSRGRSSRLRSTSHKHRPSSSSSSSSVRRSRSRNSTSKRENETYWNSPQVSTKKL